MELRALLVIGGSLLAASGNRVRRGVLAFRRCWSIEFPCHADSRARRGRRRHQLDLRSRVVRQDCKSELRRIAPARFPLSAAWPCVNGCAVVSRFAFDSLRAATGSVAGSAGDRPAPPGCRLESISRPACHQPCVEAEPTRPAIRLSAADQATSSGASKTSSIRFGFAMKSCITR